MIIKGKAVEQLLNGPGPGIRLVLFYGPDEGRVRENAARVARTVVQDLSDPFRVSQLSGGDLKSDPARLLDEAAALSLTGGRRVVRLRGIGDAQTDILATCLQAPPGDSLIVAEAGELAKTSRLRKLCEDSPHCAIAACYEDSLAELETVVVSHLLQHGLRLTSDAKAYLLQYLGEDRFVTRQELDKLILYKAPRSLGIADISDTAGITGIQDIYDTSDTQDIADTDDVAGISDIYSTRDTAGIQDTKASHLRAGGKDTYGIKDTNDTLISLADVQACIGDTTSQGLDGVCDAMAAGDLQSLDRRLVKAYETGLSPVGILRAAANHLLRLQLAASLVAQGSPVEAAIRNLKPPVFFPRSDLMTKQLRLWNMPRLARALDLLLQAEAACKTTGAPDDSICGQTLMQVALLIPRGR